MLFLISRRLHVCFSLPASESAKNNQTQSNNLKKVTFQHSLIQKNIAMKKLSRIVVVMLVLSSSFSFGQKKSGTDSEQKTRGPVFAGDFNKISNLMNSCAINNFKILTNTRRKIIGSVINFPEQLSNYVDKQSFIEMDDRLLNCATVIIDSLATKQPPTRIETQVVTVHDTIIKPVYIPDPETIAKMQQICKQKMTYLSIGSGSLILVLLLLLYKFIRAHKIFKDLYDKIYDKILDELAEKFLVGIGVKDDDKFKDKIKKLVELNQRRKNGEMKLDEYVYKVDVVLE